MLEQKERIAIVMRVIGRKSTGCVECKSTHYFWSISKFINTKDSCFSEQGYMKSPCVENEKCHPETHAKYILWNEHELTGHRALMIVLLALRLVLLPALRRLTHVTLSCTSLVSCEKTNPKECTMQWTFKASKLTSDVAEPTFIALFIDSKYSRLNGNTALWIEYGSKWYLRSVKSFE